MSTVLALLALIGSAAGCADKASFVDEQEFACHNWADDGCWSATSVWGYSDKGQSEVLANCPASCGACKSEEVAKAASEKKAVAKYGAIHAAAVLSVVEQGGKSTNPNARCVGWCAERYVRIGPACFASSEALCGGCEDLACYNYTDQADCNIKTAEASLKRGGDFCYSEFWWNTAEAQRTPCQDDPNFIDKVGYSCLLWGGTNCRDPVWEWYGYTAADISDVIHGCPQTCYRGDPHKADYIATYFSGTAGSAVCTPSELQAGGTTGAQQQHEAKIEKVLKFVDANGRWPRFAALASAANQKVLAEAVRRALGNVSPASQATPPALLDAKGDGGSKDETLSQLKAELEGSLHQLSTDLRRDHNRDQRSMRKSA